MEGKALPNREDCWGAGMGRLISLLVELGSWLALLLLVGCVIGLPLFLGWVIWNGVN